MTNVDKTHVPRGFALNTDGYLRRESFQRRKRQPQRPMVTGVKTRSLLKPAINDVRILATKFNPDESETDIEAYILAQTGVKSTVQKIKTITDRHSSFLVTASRKHEEVLLDPNTWEEGVQVRHFYGRLKSEALPASNQS